MCQTIYGGFAYRVNLAAAVISRGGLATRSFDNCFEMWDGDAVAVAIYRRAQRNPKLRKHIWTYLGRGTVVTAAFAHRRIPTCKLGELSAKLIAEAEARNRREDEAWRANQGQGASA